MTFLAQKQNTNCMFEIFLMLNIYLSKDFLGLIDLVKSNVLQYKAYLNIQYSTNGRHCGLLIFLNMKPNQNYN